MNKYKGLFIFNLIINLLLIFLIIFSYNIGIDSIEKENECSLNICGEEVSSSYFYDSYSEICYCYNYNDELVYEEKVE